jgi:hypothetical protein
MYLTTMNTWTFGANDPDLLGWATTLAYFVAAGLCYARTRGVSATGRARSLWFASAVLMIGLGLNKQLDLQTPLLQAARQAATDEGWYVYQQVVRWGLLASLAAVGVSLAVVIVRHSGLEVQVCGPIAAGFLMLLIFIILRALPVEHVKNAFGWDVSHIHGKRHVLELAGVLSIAAGAATRSKRQP